MIHLCKESIDATRLYYNYGPPTDIASNKLGLTKEDTVLACHTVYFVGKIAVGYSFTQVPTCAFPEMQEDHFGEEQVSSLVQETIFSQASTSHIMVRLVFSGDLEENLLTVSKGTPLILIESILYNKDLCPGARCKCYFRPEYYNVQFQI